MAAAAGVVVDAVYVDEISAGSVIVASSVRFPQDDLAMAKNFSTLVNEAVASVFTDPEFSIYGNVSTVASATSAGAEGYYSSALDLDPRVTYSDTAALRLPSGYLRAGPNPYLIQVAACVRGFPGDMCGHAEISVIVQASPLVSAISGGNGTVGLGTLVTLDGSVSHDPDLTTGSLSFHWECRPDDPGQECQDQGGEPVVLPNASAVTVALSPGNYHLFLTVTKLDRTPATSTATLQVVQYDEAAALPFLALQPMTGVLDVESRVVLEGALLHGSGEVDSDDYSLRWTSPEKGVNLCKSEHAASPCANATQLVLQPALLRAHAGAVLRLSLEATHPSGAKLSAGLSLLLGAPPSGGLALAAPLAGVSLTTTFTLEVSGWHDPHLPLQYHFTTITSGDKADIQELEVPLTLGYQPLSRIEQMDEALYVQCQAFVRAMMKQTRHINEASAQALLSAIGNLMLNAHLETTLPSAEGKIEDLKGYLNDIGKILLDEMIAEELSISLAASAVVKMTLRQGSTKPHSWVFHEAITTYDGTTFNPISYQASIAGDEVKLPVGNPEHDFHLSLRAYIRNAEGATTIVDFPQPVTVEQPYFEDGDALEAALATHVPAMIDAFFYGQYDTSLQNVLSLTSTLNLPYLQPAIDREFSEVPDAEEDFTRSLFNGYSVVFTSSNDEWLEATVGSIEDSTRAVMLRRVMSFVLQELYMNVGPRPQSIAAVGHALSFVLGAPEGTGCVRQDKVSCMCVQLNEVALAIVKNPVLELMDPPIAIPAWSQHRYLFAALAVVIIGGQINVLLFSVWTKIRHGELLRALMSKHCGFCLMSHSSGKRQEARTVPYWVWTISGRVDTVFGSTSTMEEMAEFKESTLELLATHMGLPYMRLYHALPMFTIGTSAAGKSASSAGKEQGIEACGRAEVLRHADGVDWAQPTGRNATAKLPPLEQYVYPASQVWLTDNTMVDADFINAEVIEVDEDAARVKMHPPPDRIATRGDAAGEFGFGLKTGASSILQGNGMVEAGGWRKEPMDRGVVGAEFTNMLGVSRLHPAELETGVADVLQLASAEASLPVTLAEQWAATSTVVPAPGSNSYSREFLGRRQCK
eukprot:gene8177-9709_t